MNIEILAAFSLYFSLVATIGFVAYRKSQKSADFSLGSRSLSYWVTALAAQASDMSGWLFMAFPASIYQFGLIKAWTMVGLTFFTYLNWKFVGPKLRVLTEKYNSLTLSTFFEKRFNDHSGLLRMVSAFFCLLFFTFYISAGFVALGLLFESIFGISYTIGMLIGFLIVFYILLGGFLSIAWIDFFQGMFLFAMIILVPVVAFFSIDGIQQIIQVAQVKQISLQLFPQSLEHFGQILMIAIGWGLGYFGMPHIVTKFMGIKDVHEMKKAMRLGLSWQVITLSAAVCVGLIGIAMYPQGLVDNQLLFVTMTKSLFPPFFAGIILCAILASAINVMGAQVFSSASVLAEDFYRHFIPKTDQAHANRQIRFASRVSVIIICAIAFTFAYFNRAMTIDSLVYYAWAGLGCSFGPLVLVSLHTKLQNRWAALAGILGGGVTAGLWPYFNTTIMAMIPGYIVSVLCMCTVALFVRSKNEN